MTMPGVRSVRVLLIQMLLVVALAELALHIYNPLPFRVRGNRIILPVHQRYVFHNEGASKLDPVTEHTKNSLGFRGPDPTADFSQRLTILTIGGSTTECLFLSDGKTWTDDEREAYVAPTRRNFEAFANAYNFASHTWCDMVIDPLETRQVMGLLLDLAGRVPPRGTTFGVLRM